MRTSYQHENQALTVPVSDVNGYDYHNQAWVINGKYVPCSHPAAMQCDCFGTRHAGENITANADVH